MTTCRVCALREAHDGTGSANTLPEQRYRAAPAPQDGAALLLRVWREDDLRARLLGVDEPYRTVATASGIDAICDAVRAWLQRL